MNGQENPSRRCPVDRRVIGLSELFSSNRPSRRQPAPTQQEATVAPQTRPNRPPRQRSRRPPAAATIQTATMGRIAAAQAVTGTERDVIVETPLYRAVFTTRGAALKSFQLKQYKTAVENSEDLVDIFYAPDRPRESRNRKAIRNSSSSSMSRRECRGRFPSPSPIRPSISPRTDSTRRTAARST